MEFIQPQKELKYTAVFLPLNNETLCVPLFYLSSRFITYTLFLIQSQLLLEKTQLIEILINLDIA